MHHPRLVGGLVSAAALLTLLLAPCLAPVAVTAVASPLPALRAGAVGPLALPRDDAPAPRTATGGPSVRAVPDWTAWAEARGRQRRRARLRAQALRRERADVVSVARELLGTPYAYGGTSPAGFDCSGFTRYVYAQLGIELEHGATDQSRVGRRVALGELAPGDLVFYGSPGAYYHVGIYAGGGRMIHAPHAGEVVQYDPLRDASAARRLIFARAAGAPGAA